jgi:integrase
MDKQQISELVSELTLRYAGRIVTPHHFRDVVAYTWLREHPRDYLTVSKLLWHRTVQITLGIYGAGFNESSGVCAMDRWLEQREAA